MWTNKFICDSSLSLFHFAYIWMDWSGCEFGSVWVSGLTSGHIFASTFPLMWPQICGICKTTHTNLIRKLSIKLAQCNAHWSLIEQFKLFGNFIFIYWKCIFVIIKNVVSKKLKNSIFIGTLLKNVYVVSGFAIPTASLTVFIWVMTVNYSQLV